MPVTGVKSKWSSGNLVFTQAISGNAIHFGVDDTGLDVYFRGATASAYMLWDESADALVFAGLAKVDIGSSGTPLVLTAGTPIVDIYSTCASTSGSTSAEPFYMKSTMTGAGGVGGRARFHMYANVALGGWSNALKAYAEYGASGKTAGLGSALCAEMTLSAGTVDGTYAPLEAELVLGAGASTGTATAFLYLAVSGDGAGTLDDNGFLFILDGVTAGSGDLYDTSATTATGDATLKVRIGGATKYLLVADDAS